MGYIKEPRGVDLVINGGYLSDEDTKKVSAAILRYKRMLNVQETVKVKRFAPSLRKKELA